jgi:DGQHR domain-containing protein
MEIDLEAFEVTQDGTKFYIAPVSVRTLAEAEFSKPDAWSPQNRYGYQRPPLERRFKKIADYMLGREGSSPMLPQPIILNARHNKLLFEPKSGAYGILKLRPKDFPLFQVDGQHRIGGLRRAFEENPEKIGDFKIPVVISNIQSGQDEVAIEEALLFYLINTEQKRVPTDIAQRLITNFLADKKTHGRVVGQQQEWIAVGTQVLDKLLEMGNNPWVGNVEIPGETPRTKKPIMKQVSFIQSLKPLLEGFGYRHEDPTETAQILAHFWNAIREVCPAPFEDPREYVLQKTTGVFSLHQILPQIIRTLERSGKRPTKLGFVNIIGKMDAFKDPEFWHSSGGQAGMFTGQKGFRLLAEQLREQLPPPGDPRDRK